MRKFIYYGTKDGKHLSDWFQDDWGEEPKGPLDRLLRKRTLVTTLFGFLYDAIRVLNPSRVSVLMFALIVCVNETRLCSAAGLRGPAGGSRSFRVPPPPRAPASSPSPSASSPEELLLLSVSLPADDSLLPSGSEWLSCDDEDVSNSEFTYYSWGKIEYSASWLARPQVGGIRPFFDTSWSTLLLKIRCLARIYAQLDIFQFLLQFELNAKDCICYFLDTSHNIDWVFKK